MTYPVTKMNALVGSVKAPPFSLGQATSRGHAATAYLQHHVRYSQPATFAVFNPLKEPSGAQGPQHATSSSSSPLKPDWKHLLAVPAYYGAGLLLRRKASLPSRFSLLSSDWRSWAQIGLGIGAYGSLKKAFNWNPPPWLGALGTVGVIGTLMAGFQKKSLVQLGVMAPVVAGVVQGANYLNDTVGHALEEKANIPKGITKLAVSIGMMIAGLKTYPVFLKGVALTGLLGKAARQEALKGSALAGGMLVACARGCCQGTVLCMSEIGEMLAAFGGWFKDSTQGKHHETRS